MRLFATFNTIPEAPYVLPLGNNEAPKTIKDGLLGTNSMMVVDMEPLGTRLLTKSCMSHVEEHTISTRGPVYDPRSRTYHTSRSSGYLTRIHHIQLQRSVYV